MSTTLSFVGFLLPLLFILFLMTIVLTEHFSVEQSLGFLLLFLLLCLTVFMYFYQDCCFLLKVMAGCTFIRTVSFCFKWWLECQEFIFNFFLSVCVPPSTFIISAYLHYRGSQSMTLLSSSDRPLFLLLDSGLGVVAGKNLLLSSFSLSLGRSFVSSFMGSKMWELSQHSFFACHPKYALDLC